MRQRSFKNIVRPLPLSKVITQNVVSFFLVLGWLVHVCTCSRPSATPLLHKCASNNAFSWYTLILRKLLCRWISYCSNFFAIVQDIRAPFSVIYTLTASLQLLCANHGNQNFGTFRNADMLELDFFLNIEKLKSCHYRRVKYCTLFTGDGM